ncbi:MAG TPA: hypothetical protein VK402_14460 [Blastococcus sp.]|nr:hypothetical protein [Blastococcus sp.]
MTMPEPTDAGRDRSSALAPDGPGIEVEPMFRNLGAALPPTKPKAT